MRGEAVRAAKNRLSRRAARRLKGATRWAGRKGFRGTRAALTGKKGVRSPKRLAGWLKGRAKRTGVLSPKHRYGRRRRR